MISKVEKMTEDVERNSFHGEYAASNCSTYHVYYRTSKGSYFTCLESFTESEFSKLQEKVNNVIVVVDSIDNWEFKELPVEDSEVDVAEGDDKEVDVEDSEVDVAEGDDKEFVKEDSEDKAAELNKNDIFTSKMMRSFVDNWGNYLFDLPVDYDEMSVDEIVKYFNDNFIIPDYENE